MAKNKYNQVFATGITSNTDDLLFIYEAISLKDEFIVQAVRGGFEEGDPRRDCGSGQDHRGRHDHFAALYSPSPSTGWGPLSRRWRISF